VVIRWEAPLAGTASVGAAAAVVASVAVGIRGWRACQSAGRDRGMKDARTAWPIGPGPAQRSSKQDPPPGWGNLRF